ncbi:uncharacterized protein LOC144434266 [Glandiceps talaboti]
MSAPMKHHERNKICYTRPKYREGRRERAVKVYTINKESRYLLIQGVPAIKLEGDLLKMCSQYGSIEEHRILKDYPAEEFTEVYLVKYHQFQSARFAKRKLDDKPFFGGVLHVCYAPEYESVQETREKLQERKRFVARKLRQLELDKASQAQQSLDDANQISVNERTQETEAVTQQSSYTEGESIKSRPSMSSSLHPQTFVHDKTDFTESSTVGQRFGQQDDRSFQSSDLSGMQPIQSMSGQYLELPAPPRELPPWQRQAQHGKPTFDHARVPSANSVFPADYNPFINRPSMESFVGPKLSLGMQIRPKATSNRNTAMEHHQGGAARAPIRAKINPVETQSQVSAQTSGETHNTTFSKSERRTRMTMKPSFVPRQMQALLKRKHSETEHDVQRTSQDTIHVNDPATGDASMDRTVSVIRNRMRAVSQVAVTTPSTSTGSLSSSLMSPSISTAPLIRPPIKRKKI